MELTELSLATSQRSVHQKISGCYSSSTSESEGLYFSSRKRKYFADHHQHQHHHHPYSLNNGGNNIGVFEPNQTSVDLQAKDPLPLDWEQCLDLESGRMYYLNRKTLKKSWTWPKDQKLDLELNMSADHLSSDQYINTLDHRSNMSSAAASTNNMVALACTNCHLLVILSKSSPCCPNCKFVHSLRTQPTPQRTPVSQVKTHNTLSLLI
ncbi:hypothetical protein ACFE04_008809 [Oxalis oulophora]